MIKRRFLLPLIIATISLLAFWLLKPDASRQVMPPVTQLPWEITVNEDGTTTVFHLTLERSTAADAVAKLATDHDLALIDNTDTPPGLELYFSNFQTGPIKAKLVIGLQSTTDQLRAMQQRAETFDYTSSGARKYRLQASDVDRALQLPISSLTLLPSAALKPDVINARFGDPKQVIKTEEGHQHWLYPNLGLDIVINEDGKDAIQYVAPQSFDRLSQPLIEANLTDTTP